MEITVMVGLAPSEKKITLRSLQSLSREPRGPTLATELEM
jgi:hypothetical protein